MPVLKGISSVMTPDLLKVLAEMGHSDQIGILVVFIEIIYSNCRC